MEPLSRSCPHPSLLCFVETAQTAPEQCADERAQAEFWAGDQCFAIWEPERVGGTFEPQRNGHIAFHVDDVEAARSDLESKGVEFLGETLDTGVCKMALFRDPDGNDLMLHGRYAPREGAGS